MLRDSDGESRLRPSALVARLGDLRGFGPAIVTHFSTTSASEWAEGQSSTPIEGEKESTALNQNGFQLGLSAFFTGRREANGRHREAVSDALVMATYAGAQKELKAAVAEAWATYQKPGLEKGTMRSLPGSVTLGAFVAGKRGATGNVFFSVGRCVFMIGDAVHDAPARAAAADPSMAAAKAVYRRAGPYCG